MNTMVIMNIMSGKTSGLVVVAVVGTAHEAESPAVRVIAELCSYAYSNSASRRCQADWSLAQPSFAEVLRPVELVSSVSHDPISRYVKGHTVL